MSDSRDLQGRRVRTKIGGETVEGTVTRVEQPTGVGGPGNREPIVEIHIQDRGHVRYSVRRKLGDAQVID